ncbi:sigma-70 family RNA polymerase sigma factor [Aquiflexum lacus]|uniref:sigma-70 family RNA polymerase sigma factor n=1 Tax=Aquiflexum lacus TaxID=2483805 RepID=UPI001895F719|nr:sigma-70 family RNA polymerase sigma factor [Aquiflexum lacus]
MEQIQQIHNQFGDHLKNFIRSKVMNEDDVLDIYQNVIFKIINGIDTLKQHESLKSWLFTITNNQIIDFYRSQNKDKLELLALEKDGGMEDNSESNSYQIMEGCIHDLIKELPEDYKKIITLSEIEQKSQKEIAKLLGVKYVTLRSKVQRGRNKLKIMLQDRCKIEQGVAGNVTDCIPKLKPTNCCDEQNLNCGQH